jgi:ATP-dependent Zn protease
MKRKNSLKRVNLSRIKQIALSIYPDELTIESLAKAILSQAFARKLLADELGVNENAIEEYEFVGKVMLPSSDADKYEWPEELLEEMEFDFTGIFDDDEKPEEKLEKVEKITNLQDLIKNLISVTKRNYWYKRTIAKNISDLREKIDQCYKQAIELMPHESRNIHKLLKIIEKQELYKLIDPRKQQPFPLCILTMDYSNEFELIELLSNLLTGRNPVVIDQGHPMMEDFHSHLKDEQLSLVNFRLSLKPSDNTSLIKLLTYLEIGYENHFNELMTNHFNTGKIHLLDLHIIVLQIQVPSEYVLETREEIDQINRLSQFLEENKSDSYFYETEHALALRTLSIAKNGNLFIKQKFDVNEASQLIEKLKACLTDFKNNTTKNVAVNMVSKKEIDQLSYLIFLKYYSRPFNIMLREGGLLLSEINSIKAKYPNSKFEILFNAATNDLSKNSTDIDPELAIEFFLKLQSNKQYLDFECNVCDKSSIIRCEQFKIKHQTNSRGNEKYSVAKSNLTFDDVVGLEDVKQRLSTILAYFENPQPFESLRVRPPLRLLLYGPPGTGKTMIAKAFANKVDFPFYSISASEFTSQKYAGYGATLLRSVFSNAIKNAPSVIFLDELDAFGSRNNFNDDSVGFDAKSIMNSLLVLLDGINSDEKIIVLAATNRIEDLDPALLRPKRFGTKIKIEPVNYSQRKAFLTKILDESECTEDYPEIIKVILSRTSSDTSPAVLEDIINEIKLKTISKFEDKVSLHGVNDVIDDYLLGKKINVLNAELKLSKAYNSAGFVVLHRLFFPDEAIEKISIQYRAESFGDVVLTESQQNDERMLSDDQLLGLMVVHFGGILSERKKCGKFDSASSSDFLLIAKISMMIAGNFDLRNGMRNNISYAFQELGVDNYESKKELSVIAENIIRSAEKISQELVENFWEHICKLAEALLKDEILDREMINALTVSLTEKEFDVNKVISTFSAESRNIGFQVIKNLS